MDSENTDLCEAVRKHGWHSVHWEDRLRCERRNKRLTVEAVAIGALTIVPLALGLWQYVTWLFAG